jgi:hypothetical protein
MVLKNGLSRMRGDSHVRFLGGGGAAMAPLLPDDVVAWVDTASPPTHATIDILKA